MRPPILKPAQRLAAEQSACPLWAALDAALGMATPGLEYERRTAAWRDLLARGESPETLAAAMPGKVAAYLRLMRRDGEPLPLTATALAGHWAELDAVPFSPAPLPISPVPEPERAEDLAAAAALDTVRAERLALLARLETTERDQVWWGEEARRPPRLRDCWRSAIFIPPRTGRTYAVLVFPDAARLAQAGASPNDLRAAGDRIASRYHGMGTVIRLVALAELDDETGGKADERAERAASGESDHVAGESRAGLGG